jgi:hypothetical protein
MADALRAGATALQDLIRRLGDMAEADYIAAGLDGDNTEDERDFRAMADLVQRDLAANLDHQSPDHRQGYLRALTALLSIVADGAAPSFGWDPIKDTAAAFARPMGADHG